MGYFGSVVVYEMIQKPLLLQPAIPSLERLKTLEAVITFEYKPKTSQFQLSHSYETINTNL